jgi:hypothetical protein
MKRPVTASEIRAVIGAVEDGTILRILEIGPTKEEVIEAREWLDADDYLQRVHHRPLSGRAAAVFAVLDSDQPERQ